MKPDLDRLPGACLCFGQANRPSHLLASEQIAQFVADATLSLTRLSPQASIEPVRIFEPAANPALLARRINVLPA